MLYACKGENSANDSKVHHLTGEDEVSGNAIIFLRPDSLRFNELNKTDTTGAWEADSDFGIAISNTVDSIEGQSFFFPVKARVTEARYIKLKDCEGCPMVIDRDTVNYGYILTGKGMKPKYVYHTVHSGDYLGEIRDYFSANELLMFRIRDLQSTFRKFELHDMTDTLLADMTGDGKAEKIYLRAGKPMLMEVLEGGGKTVSIGEDASFKDVGDDFGWADHWGIIRATSATENLVHDGEPEFSRRVTLGPASVFIRRDEAGGGIITYRDGKYIWIHQAD